MRVVLGGGVRGDPVPSEGDEGFLYLIAYLHNQKVYKWGFFRVTVLSHLLGTDWCELARRFLN